MLLQSGKSVIRKIAPICVLAAIYLTGCFEPSKIAVKSPGAAESIDTCARMVGYLQDQNLPALEGVEVWEGDYGKGLKLTTAHYEIFTTLLEPLMLRRIPLFMESAYRGYNGELPEPIETTTKFTIYLFADREQWAAFTKSFAGEQADLFCKIKAGAYYLNGACVAYNIGRKRTFSALGHEGWHQFNSRCFKFRLPSWLDEGVAMLFESPRTEEGVFSFEPAKGQLDQTRLWRAGENTYRLDALKKTLKTNRPKAGSTKPAFGGMIPLKELIAINPGEVLATNESEQVLAFYSQSYALVRFLREGSFGKHLDNYHQLLADGLKGNWPLDEVSKKIAEDRNEPRTVLWNRIVGQLLFQQYIGDDFDQLEREYLSFCRQLTNQK
jgi:hypothetical protein